MPRLAEILTQAIQRPMEAAFEDHLMQISSMANLKIFVCSRYPISSLVLPTDETHLT